MIYGRKKLIEDRATGALELYDLIEDPAEENNRVNDPDMARDLAEMRKMLP